MDAGDLSVLDELCASHFVVHFAGSDLDLGQTKEAARTFYAAFPDLSHRIEDLIAEGDRVALRTVDEGTHRGEFEGIRATGKRVAFEVIAIYRIEAGKIAEAWEQIDLDGLRRQLGAG